MLQDVLASSPVEFHKPQSIQFIFNQITKIKNPSTSHISPFLNQNPQKKARTVMLTSVSNLFPDYSWVICFDMLENI